MRVRDVVRNLFLAFASFLVFAGALELFLRRTHAFGARVAFTVPDERLGYVFVPGGEYWSVGEDGHVVTGRMNSEGWRDDEWPLFKPWGTRRIAVLGDSFVEALQVDSDRTFLALAEKSLAARTGLAVDLMNFGRSGYTTSEELLVLEEHALKFSPDVVVLFFFPGNDITDLHRDTAFDVRRPFFAPEGEALTLDTSFSRTPGFRTRQLISLLRPHSALVSWLSDRYRAGRAALKTPPRDDRRPSSAGIPGYLSLCASRPDALLVQNYALARRLIQVIARACRRRGIVFMLVSCDIYLPPEEAAGYAALDPAFNLAFFEESLGDYARVSGIEYLGLQTVFDRARGRTGRPYHLVQDGHWDGAGHRLVAEQLVNRLIPRIQE